MLKISLIGLLLFGTIMTSCAFIQSSSKDKNIQSSPQFENGKFKNEKTFNAMSLSKIPGYIKRYITEERKDISPIKAIPLQKITSEILTAAPVDSMTLFRLGHSSFLIKAKNKYWLIDPVFSDRASPFSFIGPKRFHQPPISIDELPEITGVIISHNHYDHMDKAAIKEMAEKVKHFIVPLGLSNDLKGWGIKDDNIIELDWWQSTNIANLQLTLTPAQHFSGRGLLDANDTLWGSWVIQTDEQSIFYSGDSGYFEGFKEIGQKYGPFDLTIIETGAYDKDWPDVHMTPEQSLQAHIDVRGEKMLPAHNGTFDLAFHPWYEPLERITALGRDADIDVLTPLVGEPINVASAASYEYWWRGLN